MSDTESYHQYAEECRKLAVTMTDPKLKKQLEEMVDAWTVLANGLAKKKGATSSS